MTAVASGYSNLELDLSSGTRGSRTDHCRALLRTVTGAEDGLVVNNAAGALVLALNALAEGREVLISRGELIEIGGSFRIPDIMAQSGARLREVGTTNRTHLDDYRRALDAGVAAILTVHRSNFEQRGFVTSPEPSALAELAAEAGVPYLYDVGSGLLADLSPWGLTGEPRVADALAAGAGLVLFSGDKLLGGPQAGCLVGRSDCGPLPRESDRPGAAEPTSSPSPRWRRRWRSTRSPRRAMQSIPVLAMLTLDRHELSRRAAALGALCPAATRAGTVPGESAVGGGRSPARCFPLPSSRSIPAGSVPTDSRFG